MAMLHELIKPGVPEKLKRKNVQFIWDGQVLRRGGCICTASEIILFDNDWQLDEPTVDGVLKERGYRFFNSSISGVWVGTDQDGSILLLASKPTTATEMTRIIDFLESLNK